MQGKSFGANDYMQEGFEIPVEAEGLVQDDQETFWSQRDFGRARVFALLLRKWSYTHNEREGGYFVDEMINKKLY